MQLPVVNIEPLLSYHPGGVHLCDVKTNETLRARSAERLLPVQSGRPEFDLWIVCLYGVSSVVRVTNSQGQQLVSELQLRCRSHDDSLWPPQITVRHAVVCTPTFAHFQSLSVSLGICGPPSQSLPGPILDAPRGRML